MKKILVSILATLLIVGCAFSCAACDTQKAQKVKAYAETAYELTSESYAFAVKKGNTAMLTAANDLLAEIKANGKLDEILNSFFNGSATFTYANPASKDGCLVVATNAFFPPFEYYEGDKFTGVDIQIASLLAEKMGKTLYVSNMEFDAVLESLKSDQADIAMAGLTVNDERKLSYDFSTEYYTSAQVLIVREDDTVFAECKTAADIEEVLKKQGKTFKIGAQKATTGYMYSAGDADFEYDGFTNLTVNAYSNGALAVKDLSNGKIDAVIIDKEPALAIVKSINANIK